MLNNIKILRETVKENDILSASFYLAIFLVSLFLISMPFCPWSQRQIMEKFHLKNGSFGEWALFQFVPSMYNFVNETWVSQRPFANDFDDDWNKNRPDAIHYWLNHYPLRYATFSSDMRSKYLGIGQPTYLYIRSRYRGNDFISVYELQSKDGKSLDLTRIR